MKIAVVELEQGNERATIVVVANDTQLLNEQIRTYAERHAMTVIDVVDSDVGLGAIVYEVRSTTGEGKGRDTQFT